MIYFLADLVQLALLIGITFLFRYYHCNICGYDVTSGSPVILVLHFFLFVMISP